MCFLRHVSFFWNSLVDCFFQMSNNRGLFWCCCLPLHEPSFQRKVCSFKRWSPFLWFLGIASFVTDIACSFGDRLLSVPLWESPFTVPWGLNWAITDLWSFHMSIMLLASAPSSAANQHAGQLFCLCRLSLWKQFVFPTFLEHRVDHACSTRWMFSDQHGGVQRQSPSWALSVSSNDCSVTAAFGVWFKTTWLSAHPVWRKFSLVNPKFSLSEFQHNGYHSLMDVFSPQNLLFPSLVQHDSDTVVVVNSSCARVDMSTV